MTHTEASEMGGVKWSLLQRHKRALDAVHSLDPVVDPIVYSIMQHARGNWLQPYVERITARRQDTTGDFQWQAAEIIWEGITVSIEVALALQGLRLLCQSIRNRSCLTLKQRTRVARLWQVSAAATPLQGTSAIESEEEWVPRHHQS